ncbi:MAG: transglutaminase domain-containing protein, partial [Oleispira sp.]|nr:transglutaminase domain-containing protein [Oleispira sp.]
MRVLKILVVISILTIIAFISFKLGYFSNRPPDTSAVESPEYREALKFIVDNMYVHKTRYGKLVAPDGNLTSFSPYDYKNLYAAIDVLDSLKLSHALVFVEEEDQRKISRKHLKDHIEGSLETWKNSRFSQHVEFKDFTEYILPYRAGNEILSDYRKTVPRLFSKISDSLNKIKTPKEAVNIINNNLKMRLVFDLRSHADLHEPDMLSLLSQKKGSCESLTQCTSLTMRAMGLAVAIDECPVWAHRNSGHQWNSFLDTNNKWIPFGGAEKNPDEFDAINDSVKAPKVFRHTFSVQENFGPPLENYNDIPQLFHNKTRIDVTKEYVDTLDVTIEITDNDLSPNDYLYLAVFNAEEWKIVSWAKLDKGKALFNDMGA